MALRLRESGKRLFTADIISLDQNELSGKVRGSLLHLV